MCGHLNLSTNRNLNFSKTSTRILLLILLLLLVLCCRANKASTTGSISPLYGRQHGGSVEALRDSHSLGEAIVQ